MNLKLVNQIAGALLYEGYILYPYRPSAVKNQQRWNFGVIYPEAYSRSQNGSDACTQQTECLVLADSQTAINVTVRFLHLLAREIGAPIPFSESGYQIVPSLEVGGRVYQTWQEAAEREVSAASLNVSTLTAEPCRTPFTCLAAKTTEPLRDESDRPAGIITRRHEAIAGTVEIAVTALDHQLFRLTVRVANSTPMADEDSTSRDAALLRSLVSCHTILTVRQGEFVSLLEPPEAFREAAAACRNEGTWPVLVGEPGERDTVLSSPIILYDYPQVAPESPGDLFDGTEIDEILTLRILTMTDEEKREMRAADERGRQLLERIEQLPMEHLMKLHGTMRNPRAFEDDKR